MRLDRHDPSFTLDKTLRDDEKYLWVIDIDGFLCIGIERDSEKIGHPSLTDGKPARIGGEVIYDGINNIWLIYPRSGRYSSHLDYTDNMKMRLLENVKKYKFEIFFPSDKFEIVSSY